MARRYVYTYGIKPPNSNLGKLWGCSGLFGVVQGYLFMISHGIKLSRNLRNSTFGTEKFHYMKICKLRILRHTVSVVTVVQSFEEND